MGTMATKNKISNYVIVGKGGCGLYYGILYSDPLDAVTTGTCTLYDCRHVCQWRGKTGGITSLAAHGPCGPRVGECLIGAPAPSTALNEVKAVHVCSPEAVAAFAAIVAK